VTPTPQNSPSVESQAVRIARFLRAYVQARCTVVRGLDGYESVLWFANVPVGAGCKSAAHGGRVTDDDEVQEGIWLEVREEELPTPPEPDQDLRPWMDAHEYQQAREESPRLNPTAVLPDPGGRSSDDGEAPLKICRLEEHPGVKGLYERYTQRWQQWAEGLRDQIRAKQLYRELFAIHTQLQREGEQLELCVGFGLLDWPEPGKQAGRVRRHMVTATASLRFLPREGVMRVECPEEGARLALEDDMLDPEHQPDRVHVEEIHAQLKTIQAEDAVWDRERMLAVLQTCARALHAETRWSSGLKPQAGEEAVPALSWAPALILRRRGEVAMLRLYDRIIEQLGAVADGEAPPGWVSLVKDGDDRVGSRRGSGGSAEGALPLGARFDDWEDVETEIFFPLPANKQQLDIVDTIRTRRGVLVQGPPGTGKSHTIANLLCHLLASGQRVLVTAENPRALAVLREKLPEELRALCISVLGSGGDAFSELNATVQQISARRAQWNERESGEVAERLRRQLAELRKEKDDIERELRDLRMGEVSSHQPAPGYSGAPQAIAMEVARKRERFGWLALGDADEDRPPTPSWQAVRWLELSRARDPDIVADARREMLPLEELPAPREVGDLFGRIQGLEQQLGVFARERENSSLSALTHHHARELDALREEVRGIRDRWMRASTSTWCQEVAAAVRDGRDQEWQPLLDRSKKALEDIEALEIDLAGRDVRLPAGRDVSKLLADAQAMVEHLRGGGKWTSLGGLRKPKPVIGREYLVQEVTVDASAPDEIHELEAVVLAARRRLSLDEVGNLWRAHDPAPEGADDKLRELRLRTRVKQLEVLLDLGREDYALRQRIQALSGVPVPASWLVGGEVDWIRILNAASLHTQKRATERELGDLVRKLGRTAELHAAHNAIGQARDALKARDTAEYGRARQRLAECWAVREQEQERVLLDEAFASSAPALRGRILGDLHDPLWRDRLAELEEAWAWAYTDRWLRRFGDPGRVMRVDERRQGLEQRIRETLTSLAAELAWQKFFERLTPIENSALKGWRDAVKQMGKGKGRSAKLERLRRMARQYMEKCRDAIPVWIMPRYLVAELIDPSPGRFDTVIVDEASQMGIGGLFVFYIGKRTVIVGDDQQISPSDVGVQDGAVNRLRQRYIPDVDHAQALGRGGSVYQNAQIRFGRAVTLREHFRCMPEIIQFSNDLCYAAHGTPLDPLRSYGGDRLEPLLPVWVRGGQRTGASNSARNEIEAQMIVDRLERCLDDPRYDGRSFGVISLQGAAQARLIERMLLQRVDPETIEERRILCGDSYAFQGDERNVVFLSMVASRGETRLSALTAQTYVQRFNVAVSRAQDQLWLFHSLEPADLKPECLRYRLIQHLRSPRREVLDAESQDFDSPFEAEVFAEIAKRGYRARTQVAVGDVRSHTYRIDLVVEGIAGRLAVECDGDRWHGEDRYEADMARQRDLERVGWEFVRVAGSAFYRDSEQALAPLWTKLDERGILPAGQEGAGGLPADRDGWAEHAAEADPTAHAGAWENGPPVGLAGEEAVSERVEEWWPSEGGDVPRVASAALTDAESPSLWTPTVAFEETKCLPDPREGDAAEVRAALVAIVREHGPLPCDWAFRRYVKGVGLGRTGRVLREALAHALRNAVRQGELEITQELGRAPEGEIVRAKDSPPVILRPRGDRAFEEVPPSEWAQRMLQTGGGAQQLGWQDRDDLYRRVLAQLGFKSVTRKRRDVLDAAWGMAGADEAAA